MVGETVDAVIRVPKSHNPKFEGLVTLGGVDLVYKLILPITREPLGLELGYEFRKSHRDESLMVGLHPSKNVWPFEVVDHS